MAYDIFGGGGDGGGGGGGGGTIDGIARASISAHTLDTNNPHAVTKSQVGLSDVDNTSDLNKPISNLTQTALDLKADDLDLTTHTSNTSNPHNVTKTQIGLDNVANVDTTTTSNITDSVDKRFVTDAQKTVLENTSGANTGDETNTTIINKIGYTPENTLNKGVNNGYCALDSGGKVPLQNLPSTLLKYIGTWNAETNTPSLTATDLTKVGHVYVVSHDGTQFEITWKAGDWLIYDADGVAEKSDNSDDVVSVNGKTGIVVINKADVGLSNVDNTSDLNKPISTLTQTALTLKADKSGLTTHTTNTSNPHSVTKSQVGLDNVVNVDTTTTANITDSTDKRFITDVQRTLLNNTSGSNTGDETTSTIQSKLGVSSATTDGYITKEDFTTFNNKANIEEVTPISHTTNTSNPHSVTKEQVGLSNVVDVDTSITTNIIDSVDKRFVSDIQRTILNNTSKSIIGELSATILSTEWTGSTAPYEVDIPLSIPEETITSTTHDIKVSLVVLSNDINVARQEQEAYSYFSKGEISATNVLKITCFDYKPFVDLNLTLEVVKKWQ